MTSGPPPTSSSSIYASNESRRVAGGPSRYEETFARQERVGRVRERSEGQYSPPMLRYSSTYPGSTVPNAPSYPSPQGFGGGSTAFPPFSSTQQPQWMAEEWSGQRAAGLGEGPPASPWMTSPLSPSFPALQGIPPGSSLPQPAGRMAYQIWENTLPGTMIRRSSSANDQLNQPGSGYHTESSAVASASQSKAYPQRRPSNRDEFDGPSQLLDKPTDGVWEAKEEDLPQLPITLYAQEQDAILSKVNDRLSQSAFDFVALYQFPIPIEPDKRPVRVPADREWTEWVYLLKRLATKRRIPARVLYNSQIKQLITVLENSLEMRHAAKHQSRPLKDDRNILQLVSAGLQVTKILKDAAAMQYLDALYVQTERLIQSRR